jgi:tRNA G10  N-methylase Trm11
MLMNQSVLLLGRQPALGVAELESLFGADSIRPVGTEAAVVSLPYSDIAFGRLGSSIKLGEVIAVLEQANWASLEKYLYKLGAQIAKDLPEGKIQIGLSAYGFDITPQKLLANGLTLKKVLKKAGRSVRLSPNNEPALSSAQVIHNHLTGERGCELLFIRDGSNKIIIGRTRAVQDIADYTRRDRERPKRDARVGMLPPKLAQTIINLATGKLEDGQTAATPAATGQQQPTILDPFCGTGVILQEAILMGYNAYGTDLEPRMVDYSQKNLEWLSENYTLPPNSYVLEAGDATSHTWQPAPSVVACEGYLGQPFTAFPAEEKLRDVMQTCNTIAKGFLKNTHSQIAPGTRLCVALPAWQKKPGEFLHLGVLDSLESLGYNRISFEHAGNQDLIYAREDQIVARELLVLTRQ